MLYDKMAFPSHHGLPWMGNPPTIDGFVEREPGITTTQLDAGYLDGGGFQYEESGGYPHAAFQCVKESGANNIYMSFVLRQDPAFDSEDFVMIVLQPTAGAAPSAADRRIDIQPSVGSGGARTSPPDSNDHGPGLPRVRTNKPPDVSTFYKRNPGPGNVWLDDGDHSNEIEMKVRTVDTGTSLFWSVEVRIPTNGWVTLNQNFGLYFNIGQVFPDPMSGGGKVIVQFPWPFDPDLPTSNILVDPLNDFTENWNPTFIGKAFQLAPGAANPGQGVRFLGGPSGVGVLNGGAVTGDVDMTLGHVNNFVVQLQNTGTTNIAKQVQVTLRLGEFGTVGGLYGNQAMWAKVPGTNPAPPTGVDIPPTVSVSAHTDIVMPWTVSQADINKFQPIWHHQCVWAQLQALGGASFAQQSVFRNLELIHLSKAEHPAVVNGAYFGEPQSDGAHDLLLHVVKTRIPPRKPGPSALEVEYRKAEGRKRGIGVIPDNPILYGTIGVSDPKEETATFHTIVNCYERTPLTLTKSKKHRWRIVTLGASYAYVARHPLEKGETHDTVDLKHELSADGAEFKDLGNGFYFLRIKPDERVVVTNHLRTVPKRREPGNDPRKDPRDIPPKGPRKDLRGPS